MATETDTAAQQLEARARQSLGLSDIAIYQMVADALQRQRGKGGTLLDVGCGAGRLWDLVSEQFDRYIGVDVVRYEGFPDELEFHCVNLDEEKTPLVAGGADVVAAVEVIEHLENPRAFVRELVRLARPGGWIVVTTPNQLSLLSKMSLVLKNQFNAFQDGSYPAHITALLEQDLKRIAAECGLVEVQCFFSKSGRIMLTPWHYPRFLPNILPRAFSDNILCVARKPW